MQELGKLAAHVYLGNSLGRYAEAVLIFLVLLTVLPFVRLALSTRLHRLKAHQSPTALELMIGLLDHTTRLFIVAVSAYIPLKTLELPARSDHVIDLLITIAFWIQAALWGMQAGRFLIDRRMGTRAGAEHLPTTAILRFVTVLLVWSLALLMLLANLGVNITALVTSLGIGGVAFALAIQNVLGDILASLAIAWDKPFMLGDELRFGDVDGVVEHIGIKSTRLRSVDGEQIIIGNSQLLTLQIHNFGRARELRTTLTLTLAFDTPPDTLGGLSALIERVVRALPAARFDHCALRGLGAGGFEFEVSFFATDPGKTPIIQLRERFMMRLLPELQAAGIGFAAAGSPVLARIRPRAGEAGAPA
ncbi:MAG TPA: mechanosensitive ion channel domain-containing protein [Steroidobacteraceae bacterium]|nr:mechanosensitive ion channel domain-containing protein [Steroidobacteraceae bacterium]